MRLKTIPVSDSGTESPLQSVIFVSRSCFLLLSASFNRDIFSSRHFLWKTLKVAERRCRMRLLYCLFAFGRRRISSVFLSPERVPIQMMEAKTDLAVTDRRRRSRRNSSPKPRTESPESCTEQASPQVSDRRKQDRRRQIDPTTCERDYSGAEVEFMRAMDDYKRKSGRPFPTWSEVLEVMMSLGYRKVAEPTQMEWRSTGD